MKNNKRSGMLLITILLAAVLAFSGCRKRENNPSAEASSESISREAETPEEKTSEESESAKSGETESESAKETEKSEETATGSTEESSEEESTENSSEEETSSPEESTESSSEPAETAHVHTLEFIPGVYASCTEAGHYEYYRCSGCGACFRDAEMTRFIASFDEITIPPTGHHLEVHEAKRLDCNENGLTTTYYECTNCGNCYFDEAATEIVPDPAALVTDGAHQLSHVDAVAASCTDFGVKEHWKCAICYRRFYDAEAKEPVEDPERDLVIPAVPHSLQKAEEVKPDCVHPGVKAHYVCSVCGALFLDEEGTAKASDKDLEISATGIHTITKVSEKPATEEAEGVREHYVCSVCGGQFRDADGMQNVTAQELVIPKLEPTKEEESSDSSGSSEGSSESASGSEKGSESSSEKSGQKQ